MRRLLLIAVAAAGLAGCGGGGEEPVVPPGRAFSTQETLTPTAHLFGERVSARLDVVVDRRRLDPDRVRVRVGFLPYRMVDGLRRSRQDFSRFTRLRFDATLRCLTVACVPTRLASVLGDQEGRGERRTFRFDRVRILYDDPKLGRTRALGAARFPPLESISRLSPPELTPRFGAPPGAEFEATVTPLPEADYALPPWLLAGLLLAAAIAVLVLPGRYVARWLSGRRVEAVERRRLSPLEHALLRVERARDSGDENEQRDALEALAVALDGHGDGDVRSVRRLAWSPAPPPPDELTRVLATVKEADGAPA